MVWVLLRVEHTHTHTCWSLLPHCGDFTLCTTRHVWLVKFPHWALVPYFSLNHCLLHSIFLLFNLFIFCFFAFLLVLSSLFKNIHTPISRLTSHFVRVWWLYYRTDGRLGNVVSCHYIIITSPLLYHSMCHLLIMIIGKWLIGKKPITAFSTHPLGGPKLNLHDRQVAWLFSNYIFLAHASSKCQFKVNLVFFTVDNVFKLCSL